MGCNGCSTGTGGLPAGCKNNGACGIGGCNKLEVFDWLAGMRMPEGQRTFDIVEVRFKSSRKSFFRLSQGLDVFQGDVVVVDAAPGCDVGVVSLTGELVKLQMKRREVKDNYEIRKVLRKATTEDIDKWQEARKLEPQTMIRSREIARSLGLVMKISDVEYQGDKTKAIFYYTADDRVDFRELIRKYADEFKIKIEMKQIGLRIEAGRVGGIGSCGRELCCSSWLTDFRAVSTSAARYQQLSLNPAKLAGQCGKLKCCLNYELDQYVEALKDFPSVNTRLKLQKGVASHFKTDIFKRMVYYVYDGNPSEPPFALSVQAVKEIIELNKKGEIVEDIYEYAVEEEVQEQTDFAQVVGQDSLTRFDRKRSSGKHKNQNRNRERDRSGRPAQNKPQEKEGPAKAGSGNPQQKQPRPPREPRAQQNDRSGQKPGQGNPPRDQQPRERGDRRGPNQRRRDNRKPGNEQQGDQPNP